MKIKRAVLCWLFLILALPCAARAETPDKSGDIVPPKTVEEQAADMDTGSVREALPKDARKILGDVGVTDTDAGDKGLSALYKALKESINGILKKALASAGKILTVVLFCSVATSVMSDGGVRDMVSVGAVVAVSAIAVTNAGTFISLGMDTLYELSDFSKALLPVMSPLSSLRKSYLRKVYLTGNTKSLCRSTRRRLRS